MFFPESDSKIICKSVSGEDTITIDDYFGIGAKYVFAKEGSAAADPSLYITLSEDSEYETSWTLQDDGTIMLCVELNEEDGYVYYICKKQLNNYQ